MLCRKPYMLGSLPCPCGGCLPCRINRRRVWAHRILLESYKHGDNCFATLTYRDDTVPFSLDKSHYQKWIRKLRKLIFPRKVRYFLSGEYGEVTHRPHFHAALFGLNPVIAGGMDGQHGVVQEAWDKGFTYVGELTWESAQYIAGYLTKKVMPDEASVREFSKMSLRPGIGASAMSDLGRSLRSDIGLDSVAVAGDVPSLLRHGKRLLPLGRYLRRQLRGELGFASKDTPPEAIRMQVLRQAAEAAEARAALKEAGYTPWDAQKLLMDRKAQKIYDAESRFKLYTRPGRL